MLLLSSAIKAFILESSPSPINNLITGTQRPGAAASETDFSNSGFINQFDQNARKTGDVSDQWEGTGERGDRTHPALPGVTAPLGDFPCKCPPWVSPVLEIQKFPAFQIKRCFKKIRRNALPG